MGGARAGSHDQAMLTAILVGVAVIVVPTFIVLAILAVLGLAVAAFADAVPNGLVRPNAS
jgi:hypothetical protein